MIDAGKSDIFFYKFFSSTSLLVVLVILIVLVKSVTVPAVHFNFVNLIFGTFTLCNIKLVTHSGRINIINVHTL